MRSSYKWLLEQEPSVGTCTDETIIFFKFFETPVCFSPYSKPFKSDWMLQCDLNRLEYRVVLWWAFHGCGINMSVLTIFGKRILTMNYIKLLLLWLFCFLVVFFFLLKDAGARNSVNCFVYYSSLASLNVKQFKIALTGLHGNWPDLGWEETKRKNC